MPNTSVSSVTYSVKHDLRISEVNDRPFEEEKVAVDLTLDDYTPSQQSNQSKPCLADQSIPRYIGLTNSGATCYLNSLLQSLYCTPEFCHALFSQCSASVQSKNPNTQSSNSSAVDRTSTFNIPYQLQLLFARLCLSRRPAVSTDSLTHAFRWDALDQWRQHDVQECLRVLFEALEVTLSRSQSLNTSQNITDTEQSSTKQPSSFIRRLYSGQLVDIIQCSKCKNRRTRFDEFLDLSLDISLTPQSDHSRDQSPGQQSNDLSMTLVDALSRFIATEDLGDHNTVYCSACQTKTPSTKQLSISQLPPILTFQLKRFVYDPQSASRSTKLKHRVEFPLHLDMSPYLYQPHEESKQLLQSNNDTVMYDLFSVLLHSGSMSNGHYQSMNQISDGTFLQFNDSCVAPLESLDKLFDCSFGGSKSDSSAYLLVYRSRSEPISKRRSESLEVLIPREMSAIVQQEDEEYFKQQQELEFERRSKHIDVYCCDVPHDQSVTSPISLKVDGETTISTLIDLIRSNSTLLNEFPVDCLRLRVFDPLLKWHKQPIVDTSGQSSDPTLSQCDFPKRCSISVETRTPSQSWSQYSSSHIPLRFLPIEEPIYQSVINHSATLHQNPGIIHLLTDSSSPSWTESLTNITSAQSTRNFIHLHAERCKILDSTIALKLQDVMPGDIVLIEPIVGQSTTIDHNACEQSGNIGAGCKQSVNQSIDLESPFCTAFDNIKNSIRLLFNLPTLTSANDDDASTVDVSPPDSSSSITVNKHQSIRQLKDELSVIFGLPVNSFTLSRSSTVPAWNDINQSIDQVGLVDCSAVFVRIEPQLEAHQVKVDIHQLTQPNNQFTFVRSLVRDRSTNIGELWTSITEQLSANSQSINQSFNSSHPFVIRDKKGNVSNRFLDPSLTLDALAVSGSSQLQICIQFVDVKDQSISQSINQSSLIIVRFQQLQGRTLTGDLHEIVLPKSTTIGTVKQYILERLNQSSITSSEQLVNPSVEQPISQSLNQSVEIQSLAKGLSTRRMLKADIDRLSFLPLTSATESKLARNPPLSLRSGDLLVVKTRAKQQSINQSVNQSTNQSVDESVSQASKTSSDQSSDSKQECKQADSTKPWSHRTRGRQPVNRSINRFARRAADVNVDVLTKGRAMRNDFHINIDDEVAAIEAACAQAETQVTKE